MDDSGVSGKVVGMLQNKQWVSYLISGGAFLMMALALLMYPVKHADMNKAGCILKFSNEFYDSVAGAEALVNGDADKPWTKWNDHEDHWEPEFRRDMKLKPYWGAAYMMLLIASIGSFVHFVESAWGSIMGDGPSDGLLASLGSSESGKQMCSVLRDILNVFFGFCAIAGVTLMVLVMSGGVCQVGNPTVFAKLDDYDSGTKLSWNLAVAGFGVEFGMTLVSLLFISGFDLDRTRIGGMAADLFQGMSSLLGIVAFLLLLLGGLFAHEYRIRPHKVYAACAAFDADADNQINVDNGHRNSNFLFEFAEKKTGLIDVLVEVMAYSSIAVIVFCVVELVFGSSLRGSMRDDKSKLTKAGIAYTIMKLVSWFAVLGSGAFVVCLWMTASTNGCGPLFTAKHAYYVVPMISTGVGSVIGLGFITRGFIRGEENEENAGRYRGMINAARSLVNPVFSSPF